MAKYSFKLAQKAVPFGISTTDKWLSHKFKISMLYAFAEEVFI